MRRRCSCASQLFDSPVLTVAQAQQLLGVSNRSARLNVERLVSLGILKPVSDASYGKVYATPDVLRVSQEMATLARIDIADLDGINPGVGLILWYRSDPNSLVAVETRFVVSRG